MRPKPISERDCLRLVRVNGPSKMGLLLDCLARKDSGIRKSAGNDRRLLMSCCSPIEQKLVDVIEKKANVNKKKTNLAESSILLAHFDGRRHVRIRRQRHFFRLAIGTDSRVLVQDTWFRSNRKKNKETLVCRLVTAEEEEEVSGKPRSCNGSGLIIVKGRKGEMGGGGGLDFSC